jgi:hypothetical protein
MEPDVRLVLTASATARPGGDSGGSARRGGERGVAAFEADEGVW